MAALSGRKYTRYQQYFLNIAELYRQKKELQLFLELMLTLATISLFTLFALRPTVITITKLFQEISAKQQTLATMDQKIQNLSQAQTVFNSQRAQILLLDTALPLSPDPQTFVRQIEGLTTKNNLALLGITTSDIKVLGKSTTKEEKSLEKLPQNTLGYTLTITTTGNYNQTQNFLNDLKNARRPLWFDTMTLNTNKETSNITLTITARIPYLP